MKIISVYNIKGGVGKTATAVNISYAAAEDGNKVLLIDMDPQGASSFYFKTKLGLEGNSKKILFGNKSIENSIKKTDYENLDILPADSKYNKLDIFLSELKSGDKWLKKLLNPVKKEYDYIIIDCPPNITTLSENVFINSDAILVPVVPTVLSIRTYEQLKEFFKDEKLDKTKLHPFYSMVERRKTMHNDSIADFSKKYQECIGIEIPYNAEIEKMGEYMAPIVKKYPYAEASLAYKKLWKKLKNKIC